MKNPEPKMIAVVKDEQQYKNTITAAQEIIHTGGSKADAARFIHEALKDEDRDIVLKAFIEGANLTEKGAPTYFYNITQKARRVRVPPKLVSKKQHKPETNINVENDCHDGNELA